MGGTRGRAPREAMATRRYDKIKAIEFGIFSPDELLKLAVAKITIPATHSGSLPAAGGVNDLKLGSTDRRLKCATCQRSCSECYGHLGAIPLSFPIYNVGFFDLVLKILKCVCYYCSALVLSDAQIAQIGRVSQRDKKKRLAFAVSLCKNKRACASCGGFNPIYSKQGLAIKADFSKIQFSDPDEATYCARPFTSSEARTILQNVSDANASVLGLNPSATKPANFIMTVFCVVPPVIRPSVVIAEGSKARGHDDLTSKICDIVKSNNNVRTILEREASSIPEVGLSIAAQAAVNELTYHAGTFMNNDIRGQKPSFQRTGTPCKSIMSRLKGKDGRIRGTLMGKRVDFSSRSVISPDPSIDVDEIGVPYEVAQTLTLPEKVTDLNLAHLRERVRNGPHYRNGAYSVIRDGTIVLLQFADADREANALKPGDTVERYIRDGDIVLFNRQPSLHKGSMMGFRVKLMRCKTFRMNLACAPSFNADADGDEMNVHVLQDAESQTEARMLMAAPLQIVSPQSNKPCMGLVQDSLLGSYLLCHDSVRLTRMQMCELKAVLRYSTRSIPEPAFVEKGEAEGGQVGGVRYWTGRQALELTFPEDLHYVNRKANPPVIISRGKFLQGRLCKLSLGTTCGSIVHRLWLDYSPLRSSRFMSDVQRLVMRFLLWRGFSVRFSDCLTGKEVQSQVRNIIQFAEDKAKRVVDNKALCDALPSETEMACNRIANHVLTNIGKVVHASMDENTNSLSQTVNSGSKGNLINVAQIMGTVGQQSVEGKRVPSKVHGIQRIPLSADGESLLRPSGFISASYVGGLRPDEFFFHNVSGREGLIDTSVKTATTGYMQRRLMKALETLKVEYDRTVRNSRDDIVQFVYGADDYDASFLVRVSLEFILKPTAELEERLTASERREFLPLLDRVRRDRVGGATRSSGGGGGEVDTVAFVPLRVDTVFATLEYAARSSSSSSTSCVKRKRARDSAATDEWRDALVERLCAMKFGARDVQKLFLRWSFRDEVVGHMSDDDLEYISLSLGRQVRKATIDAAEMVGPVASHSISSNLTQMVLNTFHYAGVAEKNVTLGVPRIKELIDVAKVLRTPTMRLFPIRDLDRGGALKYLKNSLVHFSLGRAVRISETPYAPAFHRPVVDDEAAEAEEIFGRDELVASRLDERLFPHAPSAYNPFLCVLKLRKEPLLERNLTPADVAELIEGHLSPAVHVVYAQAPMTEWFVHVRPLGMAVGQTQFADKPAEELVYLKQVVLEMCDRLCKDCFLGGIPGVKSIEVGSAAVSRQAEGTGDVETDKLVMLETEGSNLLAALGLPELRMDLTTSNDVLDTYNTLGIEAAARVLFDELETTIGFDGNFINPRHLALLVSLMTHNKSLCPISRHGLNRLPDSSVLAKCSFEETCDILLDAAAFGEVDHVRGVSECVAIGAQARIGTGACAVLSTVAPPAREDVGHEEEEDEVVFTTVDAVLEKQTCRGDSAAIELPYVETTSATPLGSMSLLPTSHLQHSFLQMAPQVDRAMYAPSSPRRAPSSETSKRGYAPSSPRAAQRSTRPCLGPVGEKRGDEGAGGRFG